MYEISQQAGRALRSAVVFLLTLMLCTGTLVQAAAFSDTDVQSRMLIPVGHTVGIKLFSKGVLVVRQPEHGTPAQECGLKSGDVILQCAGKSVTSTEQFRLLLQNCEGSATDLQVQRDGGNMTLYVEPKENETGEYCIGAWIRDSMAGIGTMTYYDPASGEFGALGHGITDVDTALLMPFSNGAILPSSVREVKKGAAGSAGELQGKFDLSRDIGRLYANTASGVFGTMAREDAPVSLQAVPTGVAAEGTATILSNVRGDQVEEFEIKILKVMPDAKDGRELLIAVTDPDLIAVTGGIVQGQSGSPILQNGKLVGAVTHVLLNDPCKGYGISIETMLETAER